MLILSTYRAVLHPSYLQKVFSFIVFIKERYSFTILSEKSRAPGCGAQWAELKSDEHLSAITSKHLMSFHLPPAVLNHDRDLWVHDPGCLHDPSAHAHNDVVESAHAQMTILFCDDLRHCTICSTLAHLSLLSSVNTIEGIIFLI